MVNSNKNPEYKKGKYKGVANFLLAIIIILILALVVGIIIVFEFPWWIIVPGIFILGVSVAIGGYIGNKISKGMQNWDK